MALKREVSESVSNLRHSVKRMALEDSNSNVVLVPRENNALEPVLSISQHNFEDKYEKLNEIGRGGFSVVYRCKNKITNEIYAVKVSVFLFVVANE